MDDVATRPADSLYERDFYAWTQEQALLLQQGRLDEADLANLIEEIESLGRKEVSELRSRYRVLALHLLKLIYQPSKATRSWRTTILNQRLEIEDHIGDDPSLKSKADGLFAKAYADARALAASETGLSLETFPVAPPFTRQQAVDQAFVPTDDGTVGR